MRTLILTVAVILLLIAGYVGVGKELGLTYIPVTPTASFSIGTFKPSKTEYNYKHYDNAKAMTLLASVNNRFSDGDIVAVDGLKWKKNEGYWEPIPNPPIPVLKPGDDVCEHTIRYAEWINNHPHFGYPPIPMDNKE